MSIKRNKKQVRNPIEEIGYKIRVLVLDMSARSKSGETGASLSISDILAVLYFKIMRINPQNPDDPKRDRFVLSKGHAAAALYAVLALRGYFPEEVLKGHRMNEGLLHAHPSRDAVPGVEVSTGSLGHGLAVGTGMAEAIKASKAKVYVLIGNGECDEGSIWESAHYIGSMQSHNIVAIIDDNKFQGYPLRRKKDLSLADKWRAFGWHVQEVDGHDVKALEKALKKAAAMKKPAVIIANTVAGKGVPKVEHTHHAHYYVPDQEAVEALKKRYEK